MVRVFVGFWASVAASATLTQAQHEAGMTLELHPLPKPNIRPERYTRRLNIEEDAPEIVPMHLGLGCVQYLNAQAGE